MCVDSGKDVQGQGQGGATVFCGDDGLFTRAHAIGKGPQFQLKRFPGWDHELMQAQLRCGVLCGHGLQVDVRAQGGWGHAGTIATGDVDDEHVLPGVVNGDVLMGLKEAELSHPFRTDAAGREIGNAAGSKFYTGIGDVNF